MREGMLSFFFFFLCPRRWVIYFTDSGDRDMNTRRLEDPVALAGVAR